MERKIEAVWIDEGFGFPVKIRNVPMVKVRGHWAPEINYKQLAKTVLLVLTTKPARLTGAEVRFIRTHFELTLKDFAERFDVSHPAVIKWEAAKQKATSMNWSTEKDIRLFVLSRLGEDKSIIAVYKQLEVPASAKAVAVDFDAKKVAA
ncbi:MAG: hypothetical protein KA715_02405 [Xanthomonadaceae bacterium]|nr:hypothetical protein [Xanthomonadaceae bacterium]